MTERSVLCVVEDAAFRRLPCFARAIAQALLDASDDGAIGVGGEDIADVVCRLLAAHDHERRAVRRLVLELMRAGVMTVESGTVRIRCVRVCEPRRHGVPQRIRMAVIARDGDVCRICGGAIADGGAIHIDHIIPVVRGGKTVMGNLRVSHAVCNLRKGASAPEIN